MAGYSGTPLPKKLGIRAGARVALLHAPAGFERALGALPDGATVRRGLRGKGSFDVILLFVDRASSLRASFGRASSRLTSVGGLWVCWPKRSSGVLTDVKDGVVRDVGLSSGLVDNKVCAVDATWSGLRFVVRLKDRRNGD